MSDKKKVSDTHTLRDGYLRKGNVNPKPTTPKPNVKPPGQAPKPNSATPKK